MIFLEIGIALALFGSLLLAVLGARRYGRAHAHTAAQDGQIGALQGAVLGLLGLLLGFSFAGAGTRFIDRQDLVTAEANAIGTAALRADLLAEPERSALRDALRRYTALRLEHFHAPLQERAGPLAAEAGRLHAEIWRAASAGVARAPQFAVAVLNPVNEVIDLFETRRMAARRHLPIPVYALLLACSFVGVASVGYGDGRSGGRHRLLCAGIALIVAAALWLAFDLDFPRRGLIRMSDAPLRHLAID